MSVAPSELEKVDVDEVVAPDVPWVTIVWNDPVNLMSYVTYVFESYFGYPRAKAEKLMIDVHRKGRAVVSNGSREEMERDTEAMHGFGLWATFEKDAKFPVTVEDSMEAGLTVMAIDRAQDHSAMIDCADMWSAYDEARAVIA